MKELTGLTFQEQKSFTFDNNSENCYLTTLKTAENMDLRLTYTMRDENEEN